MLDNVQFPLGVGVGDVGSGVGVGLGEGLLLRTSTGIV
jgi:hypothetical protein